MSVLEKSEAGAPETRIEVTPAMVEAGAVRFRLADIHILQRIRDCEMERVRITGESSPELKRLCDL